MTTPVPDDRSAKRRKLDEQMASEPQLPPLSLPADAATAPVEAHLARCVHPVAFVGVVENGLVRHTDPNVRLPEHTRVIIVAQDKA